MINQHTLIIYSTIFIISVHLWLQALPSEAQFIVDQYMSSRLRRGQEKKGEKLLKEIIDLRLPIDVVKDHVGYSSRKERPSLMPDSAKMQQQKAQQLFSIDQLDESIQVQTTDDDSLCEYSLYNSIPTSQCCEHIKQTGRILWPKFRLVCMRYGLKSKRENSKLDMESITLGVRSAQIQSEAGKLAIELDKLVNKLNHERKGSSIRMSRNHRSPIRPFST